jgi:MATE family multidrug resistance protein
MPTDNPTRPPGGYGELLVLAWPLILSNSFLTLQFTIDRVALSWWSTNAVAAAMTAAIFYWTPLTLIQQTAAYATAFVAQYTGADRHHRVGPAVWQAIYFAVIAGLAFLGLYFVAEPLMNWAGHTQAVRTLEIEYFQILTFAGLPSCLIAASTAFFAGRGDSGTVLLVNAVGSLLNCVLTPWWVFGGLGVPALGIAGAGWATVAATWIAALVGLGLFLRPRFEREFAVLSGWRPDLELFGRLMWFGLPTGLQWAFEGLAFSVFVVLVGRMGEIEQAATGIAITINMVAFLPMMGLGQAVEILVGQRLGQDRPELAEKSTYAGYHVAVGYMTICAALYLLVPELFLMWFRNDRQEPEQWAALGVMIPIILRFVAVYSLFDSVNAIFSFALRGAGDTRFVTAVSIGLAWPLMVVPTWWAWENGYSIYWAWGFASLYIMAMALVFVLRFRHGLWKSMRVIETVPKEEPEREAVGTS